MAATAILPLLVSLFISTVPQTFSQSISPQNIETFYPFSPPSVIFPPQPPTPFIDPPKIPQPVFPVPSPQRTKSSSGAAVGRAIGVTAASTVVFSALIFFLLFRRERRKRERENDTSVTQGTIRPDNFRQFNGNLRGVIVDEDGLDVLYWRNLQEDGTRRSFKKQSYRSLKDEQRQEIERIASNNKDRTNNNNNIKNPPVQEAPLLRGMSSSSQSPFWSQTENEAIIQKAPSFSPAMSVKVEVRQNSLTTGSHVLPPSVSTAVEAVPAAPPPPPPPVPKNKAPPPPPSLKSPPDPKRATTNAIGEGSSSSSSSNVNGQVKLKPLHWDKVNANAPHSMVWDKIDKGSFRFDGDLMEALFGYVATNKKSPRSDGRSSIPGQDKPPSQIFILDTRKSHNTAIVIKSLGIGRQEIIDALVDGHGLSSDILEKLTRITPTDEEISQILAFNGDSAKLADAESFLYNLLKAVPSAFPQFNAMLYILNHDAEISSIKESLQSLESACKELRTRGLFLKLLEAVLKAGNRLNAGTARGNAQAFNLTALTKLSDVKSSDGKTTLLQFVVQEVVRAEGKRCVLNRNSSLSRTSSSSNVVSKSSGEFDGEREHMMLGLPVIGGLGTEFSNVKKAATLDYDLLVKTSSLLAEQMVKIRETLEQCGGDGGFRRGMTEFLHVAELEMQALKEEQTRVMELVRKTTDYYQAGSSKGMTSNSNPLQLFVIVRDFLQMVDQVCVGIARNVQKRKPPSLAAGSGSSSSGSPRVFRFPKLPANFMSDDSRNSLDDGGSEGR